MGHLTALKRAITNLIDNAVKYGHEAKVTVVSDSRNLHIIVEDRGPGIPEHDLERVLEPYVRLETSRSRETGGVGLGLAVARDAALMHAGQLRLENMDQGGLRATLVLPLMMPQVS